MKYKFTLPFLTLGHFCIDLACLYFYFANFPQSGIITIISSTLLYNFLAFALQAPIGYYFDKLPAKHNTSIGILFVICGYAFGFFHRSVAGIILCGLGNAFYHVGGSIGIACTNKKGLINTGIFVSAGALGVSLGTWLAGPGRGLSVSFTSLTTIIILLVLIVILLLQMIIRQTNTNPASRLSTVMLFLGYLPYAFFPLDELPASLLLRLLTLLAVACMISSLLIYRRAIHTNHNQNI